MIVLSAPSTARRQTLRTILSFTTVSIVVAILYSVPASMDRYGDFEQHIALAAEMLAARQIKIAHFLFHFETIVFGAIFDVGLMPAAIWLTALSQAVTCLLLALLLRWDGGVMGLTRAPSAGIAAVCAFCLSVVGPLSILTYPNLYIGYPSISCGHNPTVILLRPLAVGLFWITARLLASRTWQEWARLAVVSILLVTIGGLTKPSYNSCLAPGLALLLLLQLKEHRPISRRVLASVAVVGLTIAALTLWQFAFTFVAARDGGIEFAPLVVMNEWNDGSSAATGLKLVLGFAFPIFVLIAYRDAPATGSDAFRLAWTASLAAIGAMYLLAESGPRRFHGNFVWSVQVSSLLLMTTSLAVLLAEADPPAKAGLTRILNRRRCGVALFALHVASGLAFLVLGSSVS